MIITDKEALGFAPANNLVDLFEEEQSIMAQQEQEKQNLSWPQIATKVAKESVIGGRGIFAKCQ